MGRCVARIQLLFSDWLANRSQRLDQTFLHYVLGQVRIARPFTGEADERQNVMQDGIFDTSHVGGLPVSPGAGKVAAG